MKLYVQSPAVCVPVCFIEKLLPGANGSFVKVYIYALYLASFSGEADTKRLAEELGLLESDVVAALRYWEEKGAIRKSDGGYVFLDMTSPAAPSPAVQQPVRQPQVSPVQVQQQPVNRKRSERDVMQAINENHSLSDMVRFAEQILGKPLVPSDMQTLYWIYDELHFAPEVILMLLEHCVSSNHRGMKYIEKVAISWHERGINTIEKAERFIENEPSRDGMYESLKKIFSINDRKLTSREQSYFDEWMDERQMSQEMIALAYETCIMQTNKLSFPYIDKIIKRWDSEGIYTVEEALKDNENFKNRHERKKDGVYNDTFEHGSVETLMWDKLNNK